MWARCGLQFHASAGKATCRLARASSAEARELKNRRMIEWFQQNGGTLFDSLVSVQPGGVGERHVHHGSHSHRVGALFRPTHLVFDPLNTGSDPRLRPHRKLLRQTKLKCHLRRRKSDGSPAALT